MVSVSDVPDYFGGIISIMIMNNHNNVNKATNLKYKLRQPFTLLYRK